MDKPSINFIQSSQFFRENDKKSNSKLQNLYIDDNGFLRMFWGYKKIFSYKSKIAVIFPDVSGNYFFLLTDNNYFVITNNKFSILYEMDLSTLVQTDLINTPIPTDMCIGQDSTGNLVLSNGGNFGVFLATLPRGDDLSIKIPAIFVRQYPYQIITDYDGQNFYRLGRVTFIDSIDDRMVLTDAKTNKAWFSSNIFIGDAITWQALSINSRVDKLQRAIRINRAMCLVGKNCVEFWYPNNDEFGFARYNFIAESGTFFPKSIVNINGSLVFLGSNDTSSPEVTVINFSSKEQQIKILNKNGLSIFFESLNTDNVYALNFSPANQNFYIIHVDETTLLINIDTNDVFFLTDANMESAIMDNIVRDKDRWIVLGNDGSLYNMSSSITNFDGRNIPLKITTPMLQMVKPFELQSLIIAIRPHQIHNNNFGKIDFWINYDDDQSQGIQTNYHKKHYLTVTLNNNRTVYLDEHVGSNNFYLCQITAFIEPAPEQILVFNHFAIEVN